MSAHTPTPWMIDGAQPTRVQSADFYTVLIDVAPADAAYIVECVNAHDELVAALTLASTFLAANYSDKDMPDILPVCRAALTGV